jgi:hypothetical protein
LEADRCSRRVEERLERRGIDLENRTEDAMRGSGKLGLAGRAGRWSAAHRKAAIFGWIVFIVAASAIGGALGTKTLSGSHRHGLSAADRRRARRAVSYALMPCISHTASGC